jgi:hypothetical protein
MTVTTGPEFSDQIAYGHLVRFYYQGTLPYLLQNFYSDGDFTYQGNKYGSAVPFGFTGVTVNRNGDNQSTNLIFPQNGITQTISAKLLNQTGWRAEVETMLFDPDDRSKYRSLSTYTGMVVGAVYSGPTIELELGNILDAVGADVPRRRLTEDLFGPLPTTANVRLQ